METRKLKEYLWIVLDMEIALKVQESILQSLEMKANALGIAKNVEEPKKPERGVLALALVEMLLSLLWTWFFYEFYHYFWYEAGGSKFVTVTAAGFLGLLALFGVVAIIISIGGGIIGTFGEVLEKKAYKEAVEDYEIAIEKEKQRILSENNQKSIYLYNIKKVRRQMKKSENHLREVYDRNVIFGKYRNLIAVSSFYEYICSERCDSLGGTNGAYNLYEEEIRMDRIISQLDQITCLIKDNQYILYEAITKSNEQSSKMVESVNNVVSEVQKMNAQNADVMDKLDKLNSNTEVTAYLLEQANREMKYMNRMDYLCGRNDDAWNNFSPM